jgi:hypothetical protein
MVFAAKRPQGEWNLHPRHLALLILILFAALGGAKAYGSSVEDLVGVFSMEKTIRLGSSSQCFSSPEDSDPLRPPSSALASPMTNALADNQAPSLAGFGFEPKAVPPNKTINFTAHLIDDESGLFASAAYFSSPSGRQETEVLFGQQSLVSGDPRDGTYRSSLLLPENSEPGDWRLENLTLVDRDGNRRILQSHEILALGLPTEFRVA